MRRISSRLFILGPLALAVVASWPEKAAADSAPSPVEAFRAALREVARMNIFELKAKDLEAYQARLRARAKAVVRPGDLRRALELPDWADDTPGRPRKLDVETARGIREIQKDVHDEMFGRLERALRSVLQKGGVAARLAALTAVTDMGARESAQHDPTREMTRLTGDVVALLGKEKEPDVRAAALHALGKIQPEPAKAGPVLAKALGASATEERRAAAGALSHLFTGLRGGRRAEVGPQIVPLAGMGLRDKDPAVRRLCLLALKKGATTLVDLVPDAQYVGEPDGLFPTRREAAKAWKSARPLAESLDKQVPAMARALKDDNLGTCLAAHEALEGAALAQQRFRRVVAALALLPKRPKGAKDDLVPSFAKLPTAVPQLADTLSHKEVRVRLASLYVLETLGPDAAPAAAALVKALDDKSPFVRWGAVRALGNMAPAAADRAVPGLVKVLADDSKDVRVTAALALGRYRDGARSAVPALRKVVTDGDSAMRVLAIEVLAGLGKAAEPAVPELTAALSDTEPRARAAAARALSGVGLANKASRLALRKALADVDATVREAASHALLAGEEVPGEARPKEIERKKGRARRTSR
jgi:HEAT repeat protein